MKRFFCLWLLGLSTFAWSGATANSLLSPRDFGDCDIARTKCAYRSSCARSLQSYMVDCADVLAGRTTRCPWACKRALISLTSSEYGYQLSTCDCGDNEFCQKSKERVEVCRPEVAKATAGDTVVPCSVAQWICHADPLCSTALDYYHRLCRSLFHGRKCTPRCNNSLAILDRQEKAGKIRNCYCDGTEDFPCASVRMNTQKLCFGREDWALSPDIISTSTSMPNDISSATRTVSTANGLMTLLLMCLFVWCAPWDNWTAVKKSSVQRCDCGQDHHNACFGGIDIRTISKCPKSGNRWSRTREWPWWWTSESVT